jgi:hypothetical protein
MPVQSCTSNGKKGYSWGSQGKCYTYTTGDKASRERARGKAEAQGRAIESNKALDTNGENGWIESKMKYGWFSPLSWERFVKSIGGDFNCQKHLAKPDGEWKKFWKFYWTWNKHYGLRKDVPALPDWAMPEDEKPTKADVQGGMKIWRKVIVDTYKLYKTSKIINEGTTLFETTLKYWGWTSPPNNPENMLQIEKPIAEKYFDIRFSDKKELVFAKKPKTKFCTEPLALEVEDKELKKFYFVANSVAAGAFCRAINKKTKEPVKFNSESEMKDAITKGEYDSPKYYLEGVSSTTRMDADKEVMTKSAIESMNVTDGEIPLRNAHSREWDSDMGKMIESEVAEENGVTVLKNVFEMNDFDEDPMAKKLWYSVKSGKEIGLSIGGIVKKYHYEYNSEMDEDIVHYDSIGLSEVSATSMPSNPGTFLSALSKSKNKIEENLNLAADEAKPDVNRSADEAKDDRDRTKIKIERGCLVVDDSFQSEPVIKSIFAQKDYDEDTVCVSQEISSYDVRSIIWLIGFMNRISDIDFDSVEEPKWISDWEVPMPNFPDEAYIYIDGMKLYPHHNGDYSLNKNLVLYYIKRVLENSWFTLDELVTILRHFEYHLIELNVISLEADKTQDNLNCLLNNLNIFMNPIKKDTDEDKTTEDEKKEELKEEEEVKEEEKVEVEEGKKEEEEEKEEKEESEEKEEEEVKEVEEEDKEKEEEKEEKEDEEKSSSKEIVDSIVKAVMSQITPILKTQTEKVESLTKSIESKPVYKTAIVEKGGDEEGESDDVKSGEDLNKYYHTPIFDPNVKYSFKEAYKTLDEECQYDRALYTHKQILRGAFASKEEI